eukprot:5739-Chlamydomonas_euryale.AAC.2
MLQSAGAWIRRYLDPPVPGSAGAEIRWWPDPLVSESVCGSGQLQGYISLAPSGARGLGSVAAIDPSTCSSLATALEDSLDSMSSRQHCLPACPGEGIRSDQICALHTPPVKLPTASSIEWYAWSPHTCAQALLLAAL